jgi:hypothetical protein
VVFKRILQPTATALLMLLTLPMIAFADGGHGENNLGGFAIDPMTTAIISALFVSAVVYATPTFQVSLLQIAIIALGTVTSIIHFLIGVGGEALLLLNALGYIALLFALFTPVAPLPAVRPAVRIALLFYTIVTFVAYFMLHSVEQFGVVDIATKAVEIGLIVLLGLRLWQIRNERQQSLNQ